MKKVKKATARDQFLARLAIGEHEANRFNKPKLVGLIRCYRKEFLEGAPIEYMTDCSAT